MSKQISHDFQDEGEWILPWLASDHIHSRTGLRHGEIVVLAFVGTLVIAVTASCGGCILQMAHTGRMISKQLYIYIYTQ